MLITKPQLKMVDFELIVSLSTEIYSPRRPGIVDVETGHVCDISCRCKLGQTDEATKTLNRCLYDTECLAADCIVK